MGTNGGKFEPCQIGLPDWIARLILGADQGDQRGFCYIYFASAGMENVKSFFFHLLRLWIFPPLSSGWRKDAGIQVVK